MAQALIRNLDDDVAADYKAAAKANGRSYEAELRDMLVRNRPITRMNAAGRRALGDDLERDDILLIHFVIATPDLIRGRQSIRVVRRVDCFVALLLAKTIHILHKLR